MEFGYCIDNRFLLDDDPRGREIFGGVLAAGYDYIETQLTRLLALSPAGYAGFKHRLTDAGVPCRVGMMLFPYDMPLVAEERDLAAITAHAARTLSIAADLGCELIVFGHGGIRAVPEGMAYETAQSRLLDILRLLGGLAQPHGLKIAVEPLCDTNMITSFPQAAEIARQCGPAIGAVFDLYHATALGQSPTDIAQLPEKLFHLHIANPTGRTVPADTDDQAPYEAFAAAARQCGYDGKLSVEAGIPGGADAGKAVAEALRIIHKYFS